MAKIICITTGLAGMLRASCALCKKMSEMGHDAVYASPYDVEKFVLAQKISYKQLDYIELEPNNSASASQIIESWQLETYQNYLAEENFDLVFIDMELHELILATWENGVKFRLLSQWFPVWPHSNLPHLKHFSLPSTSLSITLAQRFFKFKDRMRRKLKHEKDKALGNMTRRMALDSYAKQIGLPANEFDLLGWPPPIVYSSKKTVHMNLKGLDFEGNHRSSDMYIGAQIDKERLESIDDSELARCREFIANSDNLIVCLLSSKDAQDLNHINRLIELIGQNPKIQMVVALGKSYGQIQDNHENIAIFQWIHPMEVLPDAKLAIIHGGIHTINDCIYFEVPMLVYSGEKYDQNGCAARVLHHGIGFVGQKEDDLKTIENFISKTMNKESIRKNLKTFRLELETNDNGLGVQLDKMLSHDH